MELWIQVINVLHNNNYDSLIMKYLFPNVKLLFDSGTIKPAEVKEFSRRIPCYDLLGLVGT
jgi:hypothetical protein